MAKAIPLFYNLASMKKTGLLFLIIIIVLLSLAGCRTFASTPTATDPSSSPTPDPCSAANLPSSVALVDSLMQPFDDYADLATSTARTQLVDIILPMQAVQRRAADQLVPACLKGLKQFQLLYMDATIQTLLAFLSNAQVDALKAGIAQAHQYHNRYTLELARLLGLTVVSAPSATKGAAPQATDTPAAFTVINSGRYPVNLRVSASMTAQKIGTLAVDQAATALGRSKNDEWILIAVPGQTGQNAWVYATLMEFSSGDLASLPIIEP